MTDMTSKVLRQTIYEFIGGRLDGMIVTVKRGGELLIDPDYLEAESNPPGRVRLIYKHLKT